MELRSSMELSREPGECPRCGAVGQPAHTSIDAQGRTVTYASMTLLGFRPLRDDQGREHRHDPNRRSMAMRCEAGHRWVRHWFVSCWCGWPRSAKESGVV
jgi:hypothetical protein